jgi:hypothetical protein
MDPHTNNEDTCRCHMVGVKNANGWSQSLSTMWMLWEYIRQSELDNTTSCPGPCSIASYRLQHSTTGQTRRKAHTYWISCRDRLWMPCIASPQKWSIKTSLRSSKAVLGTTNWLQCSVCSWKLWPSWSMTLSKHWATSPMGPYWTAPVPYPQEGCLWIYWWDKGLRGKFSSTWVARGCWKALSQSLKSEAAKATCKHACGRGWITPGIIIARDQQEQDWGTGVPGVLGYQPS